VPITGSPTIASRSMSFEMNLLATISLCKGFNVRNKGGVKGIRGKKGLTGGGYHAKRRKLYLFTGLPKRLAYEETELTSRGTSAGARTLKKAARKYLPKADYF